jgi:hypothetical protein
VQAIRIRRATTKARVPGRVFFLKRLLSHVQLFFFPFLLI